MRFDSRDLTVKLMASSPGGGCAGCTNTQEKGPHKPPGCEGCTHTEHGDFECECDPCTNTQSEVQCTDSPEKPGKGSHHRQSQAALTALRQQLRETLGQAG
jgi:hypothetical protein